MTPPPDGDEPWVAPGGAPPPEAAPSAVPAPDERQDPLPGASPPPQSGLPAPAEWSAPPPPTNKPAVAALITGLLGMVLFAVVLGIVALVQIARRGERGRGLAVGGLTAAALWTVVAIAGAAVVVSDESTDGGSSGGSAFQLFPKAGECFDWLGAERDVNTRIVPCGEPHDGEVVVVFSLEEGPWPGEEEASRRGLAECEDRVQRRFGTQTPVEDGEIHLLYPRRIGWRFGDRRVHCMIVALRGAKLDRPLAPGDTGVRGWRELAVSDCFTRPRREQSSTVTLTECSEPHTGQVTHKFGLPAGPFPGDQEVDRAAYKGCARENKPLLKDPPVPLREWYLSPGEQSWAAGDRTVICYLSAEKGKLKQSVMPR